MTAQVHTYKEFHVLINDLFYCLNPHTRHQAPKQIIFLFSDNGEDKPATGEKERIASTSNNEGIVIKDDPKQPTEDDVYQEGENIPSGILT